LLTLGEIEQAHHAPNAFDRLKRLKICTFIVGLGLA